MRGPSTSASTGAAVEVRPLAPGDPRARRLIDDLDRLQLALYPAESNHLDPIEVLERDHVTFLAAFFGARVVGCGAVKRMPGEPDRYGEIKRMYVDPSARGRGVGKALLEALESSFSPTASIARGWRRACVSPRRSPSTSAAATYTFPRSGSIARIP